MPLNTEDKSALEGFINQAIGSVPSFLRGAVNPITLLTYLKSIPPAFRKYTLHELIESIEESVQNKAIRW